MKFNSIPLTKKSDSPLHLDDDKKWEAMAIKSFIHVEEEIPRQPVAISIGESTYKGNAYPIPFGSYGDYSCIVGSSKSKKTFLKSAIAAGYIGGSANFYFPDIKGHHTKGKYVVDIDTEQSKFHSRLVFKRVTEMVGANSPYYRPYALRTYTPRERMDFIKWLIYKSPIKNQIGLILIDGYADLISNFNDIDESTELTSNLLKWSEDANCHITGVLHKNFGTDKPVGHIGSAVLKKAETVAFTTKDPADGSTLVTCEYSRNMNFDEFSFVVGDDWLPRANSIL